MNSLMTRSCSSAEIVPRAGDFDRHLLDLLRVELRHQHAGLLLGKRHQQDGGIVDVGHGAVVAMLAMEAGGRRRRDAERAASPFANIGR